MDIRFYLLSMGYLPYRKHLGKRSNDWEYVPVKEGQMNYFSSMGSGLLDIRYIKDGDEWCYGLSEVGKPPTLTWPKIPYEYTGDDRNLTPDDITNKILQQYDGEQIYNAVRTNSKLIII